MCSRARVDASSTPPSCYDTEPKWGIYLVPKIWLYNYIWKFTQEHKQWPYNYYSPLLQDEYGKADCACACLFILYL